MDTKTAWQTLRDYAEGRIDHRWDERCPNDNYGHDIRDPACPVCQALDAVRGCLAQIEEPAGAAPAAVAPFGYVNTHTGQFFKDVEPCRQGNEGNWRTVYLQPAAVAGPTAVELQMLAAKHTRSVETPTGYVCDAVAAVKEALARWGTAPALEAPAAPAGDEEAAFTKWFQGEQGKPYQGMWEFARAAWMARAAASQAPAAPSAIATQVIENLLQLARIVNVAVEDWGETKEDDSLHVIFHKEQADKLEEILEFFDSLPDAPESEGVILSGPSRAARVLRAQAAPAAPAVGAFTHAELLEIKRAVEEFADCNETDVDYALLLRAAQAGYLECTQFHVLNQSALDLDTVAAAQAKEGGAA